MPDFAISCLVIASNTGLRSMSRTKLPTRAMVSAGWHLVFMGKFRKLEFDSKMIFRPDTSRWTARHNTVRAHAEAWHVYDKEFRAEQKGIVDLVLLIIRFKN